MLRFVLRFLSIIPIKILIKLLIKVLLKNLIKNLIKNLFNTLIIYKNYIQVDIAQSLETIIIKKAGEGLPVGTHFFYYMYFSLPFPTKITLATLTLEMIRYVVVVCGENN